MNIAYVGCGYVFDIYMRTRWAHRELTVCGVFDIDPVRAQTVGQHYGLHIYPDYATLLADEAVTIVVNLTNINSHYEVCRRALAAGKHVYSEKPLTTDIDRTQKLFRLAQANDRMLMSAPCNIYSDTISTMWKAVRDGAIGKPVLVYAELDDSPAHLMNLESVRSPTGAPFPYVEEFQAGCTFEHIGYHLVWICAMFGPVTSVTAHSKSLIRRKTDTPLSPGDTPDYSVACLDLANGVAARITNSIVAPRDQRMRIFGKEGQICADSYSHYQSPVRLERYTTVSLSARKAYSVRNQPLVGCLFGVGGRKLRLVRHWKSHAVEAERGLRRSLKQRFVGWVRRREIYSQDKLLGVAEMARAIQEGRPQPLPPEFLAHINELTLLVQRAGPTGSTSTPTTSFKPIQPRSEITEASVDYRASYRTRLLERVLARAFTTLHRD